MRDASKNLVIAAKAIQVEIDNEFGPPEEGVRATGIALPPSVVRQTRGYIEKVTNQINGTYQYGWYDACAVMIRRLLETLIIEVFEHHSIASRIQDANGDFLYLRDLIDRTMQEKTWNLSRNTKRSLPKLKDIGDKSAHSRRFNAQRGDLQPLLGDVRVVVQEFVYLAGLK